MAGQRLPIRQQRRVSMTQWLDFQKTDHEPASCWRVCMWNGQRSVKPAAGSKWRVSGCQLGGERRICMTTVAVLSARP